MKDLLLDYRPIVEKYFCMDYILDEQLVRIFNEIDCGEQVKLTPSVLKISRNKKIRATSFDCYLSQEALEVAAECFNEFNLVQEVLDAGIMNQFLNHTLPSPLTSNNNCGIALFFATMKTYRYVSSYWVSVIARKKCIMRKSGNGFVIASDLYSALNTVENRKATPKDKKIMNYVERIDEIMNSNNNSSV